MDASRKASKTPELTTFDIARRWNRLQTADARAEIFDQKARHNAPLYANNIEGYLGTISTPVGLGKCGRWL
jgi:hypothetical protein